MLALFALVLVIKDMVMTGWRQPATGPSWDVRHEQHYSSLDIHMSNSLQKTTIVRETGKRGMTRHTKIVLSMNVINGARNAYATSVVGPSGGALPPMQDLPAWYDASPVWMVNLPRLVSSVAVAILAGAALVWLSRHPSPLGASGSIWSTWSTWLLWSLGLCVGLMPLVLAAGMAFDTAATRIVIDAARVTLRTGIATRRTASVELYRLVNVDAVTVTT
ncbi:hypothetical protein BPMI_01901c [Candidatus Burkholderia pumila]|uniref:Uncharacterized protein n=1 Tax=Candidatus Burkholderia pumila TaxID=1090375 RepID=A0ABR5HPM1_9BURK|nr:hypothetical protein BPMI_01901c [Candidatus Burkholderia pumila]